MTAKKIVFSTHALQRIKQRGLTQAWVTDIIENHHVSLPRQADNTQEFRQTRSGNTYYAVVEHKKSIRLVITAGETGKP